MFEQGGTPQQKELIEQAATVVANDNVELACCFIQKCAVEKAIPEMDRRLATVSKLFYLPQCFHFSKLNILK